MVLLIDIKHARRAGFHNPCGYVTDNYIHRYSNIQLYKLVCTLCPYGKPIYCIFKKC